MAKQEITFDTNNIYINGKKHSAKTYKTCSTLLYILAIIALIIGIPTFIAGGFIFVIIALFCIWLGRKYGLYTEIFSLTVITDAASICTKYSSCRSRKL